MTKFFDRTRTHGRPAFATYKGDLYLLHRGNWEDETISYMKYDADHGWGKPSKISDSVTAKDVGACEFNDELHVVHRGGGNETILWHTWFENGNWAKKERISWDRDFEPFSGPALAVFRGALYCVVCQTDDRMWWGRFDGHRWEERGTFGYRPMKRDAGPALAVYKDVLYCVVVSGDSTLFWSKFDGKDWSQLDPLGQVEDDYRCSMDSPALCVFGEQLYCVVRGDFGELCWTVFDGFRWSQLFWSEMEVGQRGLALTAYWGKNSMEKEQLFCAFESDHYGI